jgi:hypothetical protein
MSTDRHFAAKIRTHAKITIECFYHGTKLWALLISFYSRHFSVCFSIGIPCSNFLSISVVRLFCSVAFIDLADSLKLS